MTFELAPRFCDAFARDGFVMVPDLLSAAELQALGDAVDRAVDRRRDPTDHRPLSERTPYEQVFTHCLNLWEDDADVRRWTFHPRLAACAAALLAAPALRVWCDQALYKDPGGRATPQHQDQTRFPIEETDTLTAWIPLAGATFAEGTLGYVPESHRVGKATYVDALFRGGGSLAGRAELQRPAVFVDVPPGGVAFHHVLTFHRSSPNSGPRRRRAFAVTYFRDGSHRGSSLPHPTVDRDDLAVGQLIAGPGAPLVWPPPTKLPDAPPPLRSPPFGWPGVR